MGYACITWFLDPFVLAGALKIDSSPDRTHSLLRKLTFGVLLANIKIRSTFL